MSHCWQRSTAGQYIYCCVHKLQNSREAEQGKLCGFDYLTSLWWGDFFWHNMAQQMVLYSWKTIQYFGGLSAEGDDVHESRFILSLILWRWTTRTKGLEGKRKREYLNGTAKIESNVNHMFQEIHILCFSILSYVLLWHYVYDISVTRPTQKRYPLETRHMIISSFSFPLKAK